MFQSFNLARKILFSLFMLATPIVVSAPAYAVFYRGNSVYKSIDNRGVPVIIISGVTGSFADVKFLSETKTFNVFVGRCGIVKVSDRKGTIRTLRAQGINIDISKIVNTSKPICNNKFKQSPTRSYTTTVSGDETIQNYSGGHIRNNGMLYLLDLNLFETSSILIEARYELKRDVKANNCGFAVFRTSRGLPEKFSFNGNTYITANLPTADSPPRCMKNNGSSVPYKPPGY